MDTKNLLEYLEKVMTLERDIYMQNKTLSSINQMISSNKSKIQQNQVLIASSASANTDIEYDIKNVRVDKSGKWLVYFGIYYCACMGGIILGGPTFLISRGKILPTVLLGLIGVIIGWYFPLKAWHRTLDKRKWEEIERIKKLQLQDNVDIINRQSANEKFMAVIPKLQNDYNTMAKVNKVTANTLDKLYSLNIIPTKYRSFIPVSMFYDYILNKRTYSLERNESTSDIGAINIYEDERLKRLAITEMQKINQNLEAIREGQRILYQEMKSANEQTHRLLNDINANITDFKNNVKEDLSVIKYQNEQINKCTQYMSYVTYQNYMS